MRLSWKTNLAAAGLIASAGLCAGGTLAATGGAAMVDATTLPDIGGGKTVGHWGPDTPVKDRPDFYPVALDDGTPGFVKRTDIDDELVLPILPPDEVGKIDPGAMAEALHKQRNVMVQPNSKGEIWVDVYGDDAITIIGKKLMDNVDE